MHKNLKLALSLIAWIIGLQLVGFTMGYLSNNNIGTWYAEIKTSPLTPPDSAFGIVWGFLYSLIAISGWIIFNLRAQLADTTVKYLFIAQLIVNWMWTPIFFGFHSILTALLSLLLLDILVVALAIKAWPKLKAVSLLAVPYILWIFFATYLNWYIWLQFEVPA